MNIFAILNAVITLLTAALQSGVPADVKATILNTSLQLTQIAIQSMPTSTQAAPTELTTSTPPEIQSFIQSLPPSSPLFTAVSPLDKKISIILDCGSGNNVYATYSENGTKQSGVPLTISADEGTFLTNTWVSDTEGYHSHVVPSPAEQTTRQLGYSLANPGVAFRYYPIDPTVDHILTIEGNGEVATTTYSCRQ
jgi:hypothetical protein